MKLLKQRQVFRLIFLILFFEQIPVLYSQGQPLPQHYNNYEYNIATTDSLIICYKGRGYLYQDGKIYHNGTLYKGKTKGFLKQTLDALEKIREGKEGASMIDELDHSENNYMISNGKSHFKSADVPKAYANQIETDTCQINILNSFNESNVNLSGGSGGTIFWSAEGTTLPTINGGQTNSSLDLAHDMFHGLDANRGMLDNRMCHGLARSEWQTVYRENVLRGQLNLPLRTYYSWNVDITGSFVEGSGIRMITKANEPIAPAWYKL